MGGRDESLVFSSTGELISPTTRTRSRSGNHGKDIYLLPDGTYYIVSFSRSNGGHWDVRVRKVSHKVDTDLFVIDDKFETWGNFTEEVRKYLELAQHERWVGARYIQSVLPSLEVRGHDSD